MPYRLTALLPCLYVSVCLAETTENTAPTAEDNAPVWIMPAQDTPPNAPPRQPAMLELSGRGDQSDNTENTQLRLMVGVPVSDNWRLQGEYEQGKLDTTTQPGPPEGDTKLARLTARYRYHQQEWQLGVHQGKGYADFHGAILALRYNVNPELTLEWQAAYRNSVRENPELQLFGMKNALSTMLRWQHQRYQLRAEAFGERYYRQDNADQLGNGDGIRMEASYKLFATNPEHWLTLVVRSSDYDQEVGASLPAGALPTPPAPPPPGQLPPPGSTPPAKPPAPPAPSFVPKNAKEIGLVWSYGMNNEREMPKQWHPIARAGISSDHEHTGYQYLLGLEGTVMGKDRLRLAFGENKNSQNEQNNQPVNNQNNQQKDDMRKQVELRYQTTF